ncbi:MAG: sulfite exporter TauE/SafE family protein, partial [Pseudolabrys sp.]
MAGSHVMDGALLAIFLATAFAGGIVTGLAGFAMGLVVSGVWLHILTPLQTTALICGFGLLVQLYGMWKLRRSFNWRHVTPLVAGSTIGVPLGVWLLAYVNPSYLRLGVGLLLILYSIDGLLRPAVKGVPANVPVEVGVGFLNGVLGGMTGLTGVFVTVWCSMRGWSKDVQRSVYQPVILAGFMVTLVSLTATGSITVDIIRLFLYGLPFLGAGMAIGLMIYGRLSDRTFRKVILILLLISGTVLM